MRLSHVYGTDWTNGSMVLETDVSAFFIKGLEDVKGLLWDDRGHLALK